MQLVEDLTTRIGPCISSTVALIIDPITERKRILVPIEIFILSNFVYASRKGKFYNVVEM
jgi:hypothetical protein